MKTLKDLLEHQLKDLFSAESQLLDALPKAANKASDSLLKQAFEGHLEETKEHKRRIQEICGNLGISPNGETCKAMKGLISETESFMEEATDDEVMDAGLIAEAQRIEHYEIAAYGTVVRYAKELGYDNIASKLQETLDEEYDANDQLNKLAENRLNKKAVN